MIPKKIANKTLAKLLTLGVSSGLAAFSIDAFAACTYTVDNQWGSGFVASITVKNDTGAAVNNWSVNWQYANNRITNSWNANVSGSNPYTATNMGWNGSIAAGQTISFGFQGNTNGVVERPVINGSLCGAAVSSSSRSSVAVTSSSRSSVAPSSMPASSSRSSAAVSSVNNSVPANNFAQNGGVESGLTNWGSTAGTVTRSTADKRSGSASALISGRTAAWNGITFNVGSLTSGNQYEVNTWVKLAPGTPDSVITLTAKRLDDSDSSTYNEYTRVATVTASANEWRLLEGYYTQSGTTAFQHFIIEATDTTISYYADDFAIGGQAVQPSSSSRSSSLPVISSARSSSSVATSVPSSVRTTSSRASSSSVVNLIEASNPIIWADVPDPSVIRVGDTYYMSSTTMHMNPGVPIMKSTDLVNWSLVNYAYTTLGNTNALNLEDGQNAYGKGSWASSIRYVDGIYYVSTFSYTTNKTYIYKTRNIEQGPWTVSVLNGLYHDSALFFENGRAFLAYGIDDIKIIELTADASAIKPGGLNQTIIPKSSSVAGTNFIVRPEGTHLQKINGRYYVSLITWPSGKSRTQLIFRSNNLTGPYEGRIALQDQGIAQGGLIDTPTGNWYAFLFRDSGAVGRIPYLVPVNWQDGWPVMGVNGKVPQKLGFVVDDAALKGVVTSDEFNQGGNTLPLQWQWNHNPDHSGWSLSSRPGHLRLTTRRLSNNFEVARNTLTQRTFGPQSSARIAMETAAMKDGDYAGLGALQARYGFVGVNKSGGSKSIVMVDTTSGSRQEITRIGLHQDRVYFRIDMDFRNQIDQAKFYYSLDGNNWTLIGNTLRMTYDLKHFMGYRFALFNYATQSTGGYVDFDYYRIN